MEIDTRHNASLFDGPDAWDPPPPGSHMPLLSAGRLRLLRTAHRFLSCGTISNPALSQSAGVD